jgi:N-acetylglucosaminyldiphosphoundecaprenol N-acetyl-beta-D-mannosaminyltransferase
MDEVVAAVAQAIDAHRGHGAPPIQVATVNPEFVMLAGRDPSFRQVLRGATLRVADGAGLVLASRVLGTGLPGRVAGVELVQAIARSASVRGDRVFLLGAAPGVAEAAAARLASENPGLQVAGTHAGSPRESDDDSSLALVREGRTDILLVAYGAPAQEHWLARNLELSGAGVGIGVGGTFDYLSGRVRRAPAWMRSAGLEWLFRLARQPWRARRMAVLPVFLFRVLLERLGRHD